MSLPQARKPCALLSSALSKACYALLKQPAASTPDPLPWPLLLPAMQPPGAIIVESAAPATLQRVSQDSVSLENKMRELALQALCSTPYKVLQAFPPLLAQPPALGRPSILRERAS